MIIAPFSEAGIGDVPLMCIVLGTVMLALAVDAGMVAGAIVGWLRRRR